MCGIVGAFNLDSNPLVPSGGVRRAIELMKLRGPDGQGIYEAPGVVLGHTRLAVIDVADGKQPMTDPATGCVIVFNGEIYNYRELRTDLEKKGARFDTASDTEVLLKAYITHGAECLSLLSGMFAFAVYDPRSRSLFMARDRTGVKPLFYSEVGKRIFFASSVRALMAFDEIDRVMDFDACSHYLTTLRTTLGNRSMVKGINSLSAGEYLVAGRNGGGSKLARYWNFPVLAETDKPRVSMEDSVHRVEELVRASIREQLVSDVPLGGFLSGGLDSTIIACLARQLSPNPFGAYAVGYDIENYNEWPYVRSAADRFNVACREIHLDPHDYPEGWRFLVEQKGLPLSTPNEVPIYHLSRALKETFTVALSGEGADEVFGGYVVPYFSSFDFDRARRQPPGESESLTAVDRAIRRQYMRPWLGSHLDQFFALNSWIQPAAKFGLLTAGAVTRLNGDAAMHSWYDDAFRSLEGCSTFDKHMHIHARVNLEGLLFRVDSSTMAAGVEGRVPFTDHKLMEYMFTIPDRYKINWKNDEAEREGAAMNAREADSRGLLESKILLRRAFRDQVPREILERPKMSFPVPVREWFAGFLRSTAEEAITGSPLMDSLFDGASMRRLLDTADLPQSGMALWPITNLCMWQGLTGVRVE